MGFWHTGYAEFHEPTGLDDYVHTPLPPVRYACEYCSQSFKTLEALRRHRFERHPVRQPSLLLRGRPAGSVPLKLVSPLAAGDVWVQDTSHCLLNGQPVDLAQLGQRLADMRTEYVELELHNAGTRTVCKLDFQVAQEPHMRGIETAFLDLARGAKLSLDALQIFSDKCRELHTATSYYDGISRYLYGVMAKERSPESALKQADYVQHFLQASEQLSGFDRPLARSVCALVAFHFNHFEDAALLAPKGALHQAASAFAGLLQGLPWSFGQVGIPTPGGAVDALLIDQETLKILSDARQGPVALKTRAHDLVAQLRQASISEYDRMKRMLLACEALAACDDPASRTRAEQLARELAGRRDTNAWAMTLLERLSTP